MSETKKLPYKCQHVYGGTNSEGEFICSNCGLASASTGRLDAMIAERKWLIKEYEKLAKAAQ